MIQQIGPKLLDAFVAEIAAVAVSAAVTGSLSHKIQYIERRDYELATHVDLKHRLPAAFAELALAI